MTDYHLEQMYSHEQVQARTKELASEIYNDLTSLNLTVVILTLGGIGFGAEIFDYLSDYPELEAEIRLESMGIRSRKGTSRSEEPEIFQPLKEPSISICKQHILLADDIRHSGTTLERTAIPEVESYGPASLSVVTLLKASNLPPLIISGKEYSGFLIDKDDYVIGEYLDLDGLRRGKKGIHKVIFERDN
ncbi:hypothetical protein COT87_00950 [Candidatus Collierbacteria bacterium CG10_big_fil_rev_8_21_14_0_10_44_9]|uniref:Phosphoribosyltransferase domain-containing protein n=1 Tax=Candidatus Collierbacteria bacterium CG10_big_fil_rev_8_21_14_0_10_44_9 TaxID=1974535 RepID=A0A2H0VLC3_9BACT|nr:MAG: hypothetical protein COT87_00950 [Candidatus Collierbacteria bacterium CG10_big_fil_rev_8_21_14_0_10_44_9]